VRTRLRLPTTAPATFSFPRSLGPRLFALMALAVACAVFGHDPLVTTPRMPGASVVSGNGLVVLSLLLGAALAVACVRVSRAMSERVPRVRELGLELRPRLVNASNGELLLTAAIVGASEEIFFRGILTPLVGVVLSSLAFGLVHQVRGRARLVWIAWAAVMGLLFAGIFELTGSLAGPILAHVAVNAANARYLRDEVQEPRQQRALGGLLKRED
jgi:membrane protease YdiL (CAAX protease family)